MRLDRSKRLLELRFRIIGMVGGELALLDEERGFRFHGVSHCKLTDVTVQNVVSRIRLSSTGALDGEEIRRLASWICDDPAPDHPEMERRIDTGERVLFYVDPSWGAEIGVVCERVELV